MTNKQNNVDAFYCSASKRVFESQRIKRTTKEKIRLKAYFCPAAGEMNLTKQY